MNQFHYRDGVLHAEDVPLPDIAAAAKKPFYLLSTAALIGHFAPSAMRLPASTR